MTGEIVVKPCVYMESLIPSSCCVGSELLADRKLFACCPLGNCFLACRNLAESERKTPNRECCGLYSEALVCVPCNYQLRPPEPRSQRKCRYGMEQGYVARESINVDVDVTVIFDLLILLHSGLSKALTPCFEGQVVAVALCAQVV